MKLAALTITLFVSQILWSQDSSRIVIEAGKMVSEVITPEVKYQYKGFKPGQVLFKNNMINQGPLNYDLFTGEVMFLAPNGDTLAISKEQMLNIKRVTIDTTSYFYSKGYVQVMVENKAGSLLKKQQYQVVSREKIGGYNFASPASSIDSYTSFSDRANNRHDLIVRENISLQLKTEYFIGDEYNLILPINRKNLEKLFFNKKKEIETYLKANTMDFKKEKDVTALFVFITRDN